MESGASCKMSLVTSLVQIRVLQRILRNQLILLFISNTCK